MKEMDNGRNGYTERSEAKSTPNKCTIEYQMMTAPEYENTIDAFSLLNEW